MNDSQKNLLKFVGAIALGMLSFPPYREYGISISAGHEYLSSTGYAFIFDLPYRATVDAATLLVQWVGVLIVGGIIFFGLKDK